MKRKKILYVVTKSVWGGAQRYVFDLAINLPKDRFEVIVAAGGNGQLFDKLRAASIRTITIPGLHRDVNIFKEILSFWNLFKIFRDERPDTIHLNSTKIGGLGALAAFAAKLTTYNLQLTTIFTVHGWGFNEDRPLPIRAVIFLISWLSALFQDKIICINNADFKVAKKFIPRRKLALIFNGIGPIDFLPRVEARNFLAQKIGRPIAEDVILIGTTAELTKNKGLEYLVTALPRLNLGTHKGLTLMIGEGEKREKLQKQMNMLGLQDIIFLLGFIPDAARYLKAFDIFALPSLKEGLPYTIMEAMAAGLPVIATNVGGIPDLVEHGKTGLLVSPKDVIGLAEAIKMLMQNKIMRKEFSSLARQTIKTRFQLRDMIEKTIACYDRP